MHTHRVLAAHPHIPLGHRGQVGQTALAACPRAGQTPGSFSTAWVDDLPGGRVESGSIPACGRSSTAEVEKQPRVREGDVGPGTGPARGSNGPNEKREKPDLIRSVIGKGSASLVKNESVQLV